MILIIIIKISITRNNNIITGNNIAISLFKEYIKNSSFILYITSKNPEVNNVYNCFSNIFSS